jgi:tetratricopeptide (TPR) repeat protein
MQALLEVQPSEAEHLLERAAEMAECSVEDSLVVLAESHLETGAVDRAATLIDRALREAHATHNMHARAKWLRLKAGLEAAQGRATQARVAYGECLAGAQALRFPLLRACCLENWAGLELAQGQFDTAAGRLEEASEIYRRLAADPYTARAERLLQRVRREQQAI